MLFDRFYKNNKTISTGKKYICTKLVLSTGEKYDLMFARKFMSNKLKKLIK